MGSSRRAFRLRAWCAVATAPLWLLLLGARVYHSQDAALALAFPAATSIARHPVVLDDAARSEVARRCACQVRDRLVVFHEARRGGQLLGRALVLREKGKALPFRFLVALQPEGAVDQVLLLRYREPRGHEIQRASFRAQFRGKTLTDPIRRGADIRSITGATLSVDALSRGVRRALALTEVLVGSVAAETAGLR